MKWILDNREWIFSGIGVFILSLVITLIFKNKSATHQSQKSGKNSKNYQSAGNITIGIKNDK